MFLIALFEPTVSIFLTTVALVIISKILQWKFLDKKKMKEQREGMKIKQAKLKELAKEGEHKKKEVASLQQEIMEESLGMMQSTNKMMFFSLPVFLLIFWILGFVYGAEVLVSMLPLPQTIWFGPMPMPNLMEWRFEAGYRTMYIYYYLYLSIIVGIGLKVYEKVNEKMKG